ncbi:unnamed protein product [Cylindrotheca closterium]|uniref:DEP domain-containing protein n=1 Tax=Cylindrotheca closterium TaxID=2856 RepID=A0AAD2G2Q5_9STRA|nr:unnamed protein product [Cylindrotheca closterium]
MKLLSTAEPKWRQDVCPIQPLRKCSSHEEAYHRAGSSDKDGVTASQLPSPASDDMCSDHSTISSEIVSLDAASNASFNIDNSWRQDVIETSIRIESQESIEEEKDAIDPVDPRIKRSTSSSSMDTALFEFAENDTPPQLVVRHNSYTNRTMEAEPMDTRFGESSSGNQDTAMTFPRPSYSQQLSMPVPSGLQKLAEAFTTGCAVGTHSYRLKKYPNTFVGSEAVDLMLSANLASTREDAVFLGQRFCKELNLFHHVCWDHTFKDGQFFYRFNNECSKDVRCMTPVSRENLVPLSLKFLEGMPVSTHTGRRYKTYRNTFLGEDAVNYMLQSELASDRLEAVFLGQRMMEELGIFEPVSHNNRFKDSCYLYRFATGDCHSSSCGDESATAGSLSESFRAQHQCTSPSPLPPFNTSRWDTQSCTIDGERKKQKVVFGMIHVRYFERRLERNPATTSGPSLGLGWRFYDGSPAPLKDERSEALEFRGRLSTQDRSKILKEWGYNRADINRAARSNKIIRQKRNRTFNKYTE